MIDQKLACPTCGEKALSAIQLAMRDSGKPYSCRFCHREYEILTSKMGWFITAPLFLAANIIDRFWLRLTFMILFIAAGFLISIFSGRLKKLPEPITF
jgi:DNA-directed RNA polymerase subunit RPC12/RpoP